MQGIGYPKAQVKNIVLGEQDEGVWPRGLCLLRWEEMGLWGPQRAVRIS